MNKLLKEYGFDGPMDYYEMVIESLNNGNRAQANNQFKAMPKKYRISFLQCMVGGHWPHGLSESGMAWFIGLV